MDFRLYASVLWRFKWLVLGGAMVATVLAALSVVRVGTDGKIAYRQAVLWSSTTRLGVTQRGFPWGRLLAQSAAGAEIPVADPNRLNSLAFLYAQLATSDPVRQLILQSGPIAGKIVAEPVVVGDVRVILPLIDLTAIATSPTGAASLADRAASALKTYIEAQQKTNAVPASDRVVIQRILGPKRPVVYRPRPKTMPILVFCAVMFAFVGLAFVLDNARPRPRELDAPVPAGDEFTAASQRRAAVGP